ncbi:DMT family transporter [Paracoccaceae bacterium Fryx2]|nr:DMT family transporter [Paracoccaceae bacterium Fryx2]
MGRRPGQLCRRDHRHPARRGHTFQPASLLILGAAVLYAANSLTARWIPLQDSLWTVSFYGAAFSALLVAPLTLRSWSPVDPADLWLFGGAALCSSLGIGLGALAYRSASASDLAPFSYSGLIWSMAVTWLVWGTLPGVWTVVGAVVIATSSAFHFLSTRRRAAD